MPGPEATAAAIAAIMIACIVACLLVIARGIEEAASLRTLQQRCDALRRDYTARLRRTAAQPRPSPGAVIEISDADIIEEPLPQRKAA